MKTRNTEELIYFAGELIAYLTDPDFKAEYDHRAQVATDGNVNGLEAIAHCLRNRLDSAGL